MPDAEAHSSVHVGRAFALENLDPLEVARAQRHQQLLHNSLPTITDRPPPSMLSERRIEITREEEDVRLDAGTLPSPVDEYYEPEREMDIALYMAAASEEFEVDIEDTHDNSSRFQAGGKWFPFDRRADALSCLLYNSPRMRFSEEEKKGMNAWANALGADVPTLYSVEKAEESLEACLGNPTSRYEGYMSGTPLFANDIGVAIAHDFANPMVREKLNFYPQKNGSVISQLWHGSKLVKDIPDKLLTPMARLTATRHFYVDEVAQMKNGSLFLPKRWLLDASRELYAEGYAVTRTNTGLHVHDNVPRIEHKLSLFHLTYPELLVYDNVKNHTFCDKSSHYQDTMPSPIRTKSQGRPVYACPGILFIDDMSGNVSKQWNKHYSVYFSNGALPYEEIEKEYNTHFVCTSQTADPLEMMDAVCEMAQKNREAGGIRSYDSLFHEEVMVLWYLCIIACDNPMGADLCSHAGSGTNFYCRKCYVGGKGDQKFSDEGFKERFDAGDNRKPEDSLRHIFHQLVVATEKRSTTRVENTFRASGIKDKAGYSVAEEILELGQTLRTEAKGKKSLSQCDDDQIRLRLVKQIAEKGNALVNPLLHKAPGLDVHLDTPVELLHTFLLGVVKYHWRYTIEVLKEKHKLGELNIRLNSVSEFGLSIPPLQADYICEYPGTLIGKHFRSLVQVMPFASHGLLAQDACHSWHILGRLGALLYTKTIKNIDSYCDELDTLINDFYDSIASYNPLVLTSHLKPHLLAHTLSDVRRHGPLLISATERYESFNGVVRQALVHSNRQAPSKDAASRFASFERIRHVFSGGWWFDARERHWVQASDNVRSVIDKNDTFRSFIGIHDLVRNAPGHRIMYNKHEAQEWPSITSWNDTVASKAATAPDFIHEEAIVIKRVKALFLENGDRVEADTHVVLKAGHRFGLVVEIIECTVNDLTEPIILVTVNLSKLHEEKDSILGMPMLLQTGQHIAVKWSDILFIFNCQHNCSISQCKRIISKWIVKERETSGIQRKVLDHADQHHFLINLCSFHNHMHLRQVLPPHYFINPFRPQDRSEHRSRAAEVLRTRQKEKNAQRIVLKEVKAAAARALKDGEDTEDEPVTKRQSKLSANQIAERAVQKEEKEERDTEERLKQAKSLQIQMGLERSSSFYRRGG